MIKHHLNPPCIRKSFAERLKQLRKRAGLTQEQLAECMKASGMKCSVEFISRMERKKNAPSFNRLPELANALNVQVYELFLPPGTELHISEAKPDITPKKAENGSTISR